MGHKVYISFKTEDAEYKQAIQDFDNLDYIDKSLNSPINSDNAEYILRKIREEYLSDSTVTVFLIGEHSAENLGEKEQYYIKKELQASLYDGSGNTKNGILGVVLPQMQDTVYRGTEVCPVCGATHRIVNIDDNTAIKEFSYNYYIPHNKCAWSEEERYCVLVSWDEFKREPNDWINKAYNKRNDPIALKTRVRP